jgi:PmbA protein
LAEDEREVRSAAELKTFVREARAMLAREKDLAQFEVYCASGEHRVARIAYTSDIPCRGVEEMKSHAADGFAVRIVTRRDPHETGMASEAGEFSLDALRAALGRARRAALVDPHFPGLPVGPLARKTANGANRATSDIVRAGDARLGGAAWRIIGGALEEFTSHRAADGAAPGLVLGGDVSMMRDRMAIGSSNFDGVRVETGAHFTCMVTALVESLDTKGTASAIGASLAEMEMAAARAGGEAVARALALAGGERPAGGVYRVVLGAQPVAELLNYMVVPSLTTGAFYSSSSAYHGRFNAQVMDPRISLYDDPAALRGAIHRRMTCEGLPARRTVLIRDGRLAGLLSNFYDSHRLETDEHRLEKLGASNGAGALRFPPNSGYRLGESAVRRFDSRPGSTGTNLMMRTRGGTSERDLVSVVGEGIYVGRVWYTYPINGQRAGDFTCTVSGDSYLIRNGKLTAPLAPNALRINANIEQIFAHPLGVGNRARAALVWGAPEAYYTTALAADGISLSAIEPPASTTE